MSGILFETHCIGPSHADRQNILLQKCVKKTPFPAIKLTAVMHG